MATSSKLPLTGTVGLVGYSVPDVSENVENKTNIKQIRMQNNHRKSGFRKVSFQAFYAQTPLIPKTSKKYTVKLPSTKWSTNYDKYLTISAAKVSLHNPDGTTKTYVHSGKEFNSPAGDYSSLHKISIHQYTIVAQDGSSMNFGISNGDSYKNPMLLAIKDKYGNKTEFTRYVDGKLEKITTPTGKETTFSYDKRGNLTKVTDPYGDVALITYDKNDNLSTVIGTDGRKTIYGYNSRGVVNSITTNAGTWKFERKVGDGSGDLGFSRRYTVTDPNGGKTEYYFDAYKMQYYRVNPVDYSSKNNDSHVPKTYFNISKGPNNKGNITGIRYPDGHKVHLDYYKVSGLPHTVTDAIGNKTTYTYNDKGKITSITDSDGKATTFIYDKNGLDLRRVNNSAGNSIASFTYGNHHEVLTATDIDGNTTKYTYTAWGDVASRTGPKGIKTTYLYNGDHQLGEIKMGTTVLAHYNYDSHERVHQATGSDGVTLEYKYDNAGHMIRITYPDTTNERFSYETCCGLDSNQVTKHTDRAGRVSSFTYDKNGNLTSATDANNNAVHYSYNGNNQMVKMADANGNTTKWDYDTMGRILKKVYPDGSYEEYTYDIKGQSVKKRMPDGTIVQLTYDKRGNMRQIHYLNMPDVKFSYDDLNRLSSMTDALGKTTYSYNNRNQLISINGPWKSDTLNYKYDALGREIGVKLNQETVSRYQYDNLDRLSELNGIAGDFLYNYAGNSGLLDKIALPNGTKSTFTYDGLKRLTQAQNLNSKNTNIAGFGYTLDSRDLLTSLGKVYGSNSAQHVNYSYDNINQLISAVNTGSQPDLNQSWTYDSMGNRLQNTKLGKLNHNKITTYSYNTLNQLVGSSGVKGLNAIKSTFTYDANGNTTKRMDASGTTQYSYDDADRLISLTHKNTAGDNVSKSTYVYDGLNRLRIITNYSWGGKQWQKQDEKKLLYDGMQVIQERNGSGDVIATDIWDGNIGGLKARIVKDPDHPNQFPQKYFYHYDGLGNVVAITDESQQTVAQYKYGAFGNLISSSGNYATKNPWRYSTKYFDEASGLYYYGFRFYSPKLGRWINRDPIAENGGLNLYAFVENSPINANDGYGYAQDMGGGANTVRISLAAFIHAPVVSYLGMSFKGDGRTYSPNSTRFRIQQNAIIDLTTNQVHFANPQINQTHGVDSNILTRNYVGLGQFNSYHSYSYDSVDGYWVYLWGDSRNPFARDRLSGAIAKYVTPPVQYNFHLHFNTQGNLLSLSATYTLFPAFELYTYRGSTSQRAWGYDGYGLGIGPEGLNTTTSISACIRQ